MRGARRSSLGILLALLWLGSAHAHVEADGLIVREDGQIVIHVWQGQVTGLLQVPYLVSSPRWDVTFLAPDSTEFTPGPVGSAELRGFLEAPLTASYQTLDTWAFGLLGNQAGAVAGLRLRVWFVDHYDFTSPSIPYIVENPTDAPQFSSTDMRVGVYPNPIRADSQISYALPRAGTVRLELFDVAGRRLQTLLQGPALAGSHQLGLPRRDLAAGIYFLRLETESGSAQTKLIVRR